MKKKARVQGSKCLWNRDTPYRASHRECMLSSDHKDTGHDITGKGTSNLTAVGGAGKSGSENLRKHRVQERRIKKPPARCDWKRNQVKRAGGKKCDYNWG